MKHLTNIVRGCNLLEFDDDFLSDVDFVDYIDKAENVRLQILSEWLLRQFYFGSEEQILPNDGDAGFVSWD